LLFQLVAALEASQEPGTRQRFEELIQTRLSGLGAAAEDHDLQLNNRLADGLLGEVVGSVAAGFSQVWPGSSQTTGTFSAAGGNMRLPSAPALSNSNSSAYSSSAFPGAEGQNPKREQTLKPRSADRRLASRPEEFGEATISGAASDDPSSDSAAAATEAWPHEVQVYYGTNRKPLRVRTRENYLTHSQSMFAFAAIAALAVCVFGFLRSRATLYAVFAIAGLACVSIFLVQNADNNSSVVERPPVPYSNEYHDQLAWGTCQVSIPRGHVPGELESPAFHRFEFKPNLRKHVVLTKTRALEPDTFFQELHQELERSGPGVLVFIHGYNVSFEDAARRTAQMSHDLQFAGAPVFYSWPSQANWWEYQLDKKNIRRSVNQIKEFLISLAEKSGAETINVVAHSMGNVGLTEALSEIEAEGEQALFNQVVLAAPDIDADIFRDRIAPNIVSKAQRLTLYASSNDLALKASKYFNAGHRAGDSSGPLTVFPGLDVVDASAVDMSLLGHGYYGSSFGVLQDLAEVLMDLPTDQRSTLMAVSAGQQSIWMIDERLATSRQIGSQGTVR
jgi:esterase/lipase superfamily enzyme